MRHLLRSFLTVSLIAFVGHAPSAHSQTDVRYFSTSVPVSSQTTAERSRAAREALAQVLVRMSGDDAVLNDAVIKEKLRNALSMVEQFQYASLASEDLKTEGYTDMLSFTFSPTLVKQVLSDAQKPYWPTNRPTTLIWLAEDTVESGRQILNQQSDSPVIQSLFDAAEQRGLPIMFPLLDLDDQLALSADDVWQLNETAIVEASERYDADVVLVGRFSQTSRGELWTMWQFFHAGSTQGYDSRFVVSEDSDALPVGTSALDPLARFLAQRYAISPQVGSGGSLVLNLSGVSSYGHYRQSLDYLTGLAAVSQVRLVAVRQDSMLLYLESDASIDKLLSVLALDRKMHPHSTAVSSLPAWQQPPRGTPENPLRFEWSE